MASQRSHHDEDALLCERCGYPIGDLPREGPCPECGEPIARSLPESRVGSPWQQRRTIRAMLATIADALASPSSLFDRVAIRGRTDLALARANIAGAGVCVALCTWLLILGMVMNHGPSALSMDRLSSFFGYGIIAGGCTYFTVGMLTVIEYWGIRFFGARRRWRITRDVALSVCAHASVGWLVGSVAAIPAVLLGLFLATRAPNDHSIIVTVALATAPVTLPLLAMFAGMLVFETLVYIGVRRCRFANRPRPVDPALTARSPQPPPTI